MPFSASKIELNDSDSFTVFWVQIYSFITKKAKKKARKRLLQSIRNVARGVFDNQGI